MRDALCVGTATLCLAQAWVIVFVLRIGPVIAVIDAREGRGVHLGDSLAFLPLLVATALGDQVWARQVDHPTSRTAALAPRSVV